ncbi:MULTISPECIES: hypothetical protein [unclassified Mycolicibacterium]|uniref:hypothetical protein n=1 Tax=unclassified Mycolicibacterium TaxID=2636767 RepID=UPI001F4C0ADD|nr:hypothetical protein [Mycolicibacterium sp. YH-1]UNB51710.1 hypothetical protein L0M16_28015 [Mycolicibacterium sp. YH-1]
MRGGIRAVLELILAAAASAAGVYFWVAARTTEMAPPVLPNEPSQVTAVYYPPLIVLSLLFVTVAGVFAVIGVARLRGSE